MDAWRYHIDNPRSKSIHWLRPNYPSMLPPATRRSFALLFIARCAWGMARVRGPYDTYAYELGNGRRALTTRHRSIEIRRERDVVCMYVYVCDRVGGQATPLTTQPWDSPLIQTTQVGRPAAGANRWADPSTSEASGAAASKQQGESFFHLDTRRGSELPALPPPPAAAPDASIDPSQALWR